MSQSKLFSPRLGEEVLKRLGRYARLPTSGIIAGQSVASAIDEILGKAKPVYNDIDIFISSEKWEELWPEDCAKAQERRRDGEGRLTRCANHGMLADTVTYIHDAELHADGYSRSVSIGHRSLYAIASTRTEGLLNYVQVAWQGATWTARRQSARKRARQHIQWLTCVFDLNCTQAGVDIETGEFYVTPAFEQYFKTRQLQVVTGFTPAHSLLRYLKKRAELEAFGDDETHLAFTRKMVEQSQGDAAVAELRRQVFREGRVGIPGEDIVRERVRQGMDKGFEPSWQRAGSGLGAQPLSFGRKYYEMYVKYEDVLDEHFTLTQHRKQDLWLLTSKAPPDVRTQAHYYISPTTVALRFAESRKVPSKQERAREAGLAEVVSAMEGIPGAEQSLMKAFLNFGHGYLDGVDDTNLRKRWLDVCTKHPEVFWGLVALPFRDQVSIQRRLRTEFKKIGIREPWGALSGYPSSWVRGLLTNEEQWAELIHAHKGSLEPLCVPLPLPSTTGRIQVCELVSTQALKAEGARQHHCVGSYSEAVRDKRSRIISFAKGESSSERSTAEWGIRVNWSDRDAAGQSWVTRVWFERVQHQGFGNSQPAEDLLAAEETVREALNRWADDNLAEALAVLAIDDRRNHACRLVEDADLAF